MNTFFKAIKEDGDFWYLCLPTELRDAHICNQTFINPAQKDNLRMRMAGTYKESGWRNYTPEVNHV